MYDLCVRYVRNIIFHLICIRNMQYSFSIYANALPWITRISFRSYRFSIFLLFFFFVCPLSPLPPFSFTSSTKWRFCFCFRQTRTWFESFLHVNCFPPPRVILLLLHDIKFKFRLSSNATDDTKSKRKIFSPQIVSDVRHEAREVTGLVLGH